MKLRHATPIGNLPSILAGGISPTLSECERPEIWLCTPSRTRWAVKHIQERHRKRNLAVIEVNVPRSWLTRRKKNVWTCAKPIPTERITLLEVRNG